MFPHISYSDIVLLADLTSRTLVRLRNAYSEGNGLARQISDLLIFQRKLQERAADPDDPINEYFIRQDRAALVGGCWKLVNDLDIMLERPHGLSNIETTDASKVRSLVNDYTVAIHQFLVTTSPKTHIETESHIGPSGSTFDILRPAINRLVPTLIARAINEDLPPCSYVGDSKYVLAELNATMPDFGIEKHTTDIMAYVLKLTNENTLKATTDTNDVIQDLDSFATHNGGFGFTPSDPLTVFDNFMKEEDADANLHRIYETLRDYQAQYKEFVDDPPRDFEAREKKAQVLAEHLQRNVIEEIDQLVLGGNQELKAFRKYLVRTAQAMQNKIEKTKNTGSGCRKRSRAS